nr:SLAP domain-containing protein [Lactobacillus helveticus]
MIRELQNKKGQTITTYGGSYKFKNGKRYYWVAGATAPTNATLK